MVHQFGNKNYFKGKQGFYNLNNEENKKVKNINCW